jgi:hypothetical protein
MTIRYIVRKQTPDGGWVAIRSGAGYRSIEEIDRDLADGLIRLADASEEMLIYDETQGDVVVAERRREAK